MLMKYTIVVLLASILPMALGCDSIGSNLAKWLPKKSGSSSDNGQLIKSEDSSAVDPNHIGGGNNSSMVQPAAQSSGGGASGGMPGFVDPAMGGDHAGMMGQDGAQAGPYGDAPDGAFMGVGEYQQSMAMEDPADNIEQNDLMSEYSDQMGEFSPPSVVDTDGLGDEYALSTGGPGGLMDPALGIPDGSDLTTDYLNANGIQSNSSGSVEKPEASGAPLKPTSGTPGPRPNIRDLPPKDNGNKPTGASAPASNSIPPGTGPPSQNSTSAVQIRIPPQVPNPAFSIVNAVTVPILLKKGTSMSFGAELVLQKKLPAKGTVFWMVHSQRLGFNRFAVPSVGGRVNGVVPNFTPTSGPFKTFVVLVEASGKVHYLSAVVDIAWNP